ncbi:CMD domain protein [Brachybacterium muris]|uniref:CMD domain protein n=1 Tax=Brachybacterium muris TaxID=219301 RepID=UPI001956BBA0|nr:CMD domain protein [Brachybacterium muris]MBM7499390.1 CMD domain protein [Brachybacterium muris]MCT1429754.1 CMD domain protein [Brachybacterium muris]MCT2177896.1 CMD domain protein [Brachybacterium muris]MCT2297257.1 CMD domain protein [Brachybacterium muris]
MTTDFDVIDHLAGEHENGDGHIARLRSLRPQARENAQRSYEALLEPQDERSVPIRERYAVAAHVARLHGPGPAADLYLENLHDEDPELAARIAAGERTGQERLDAALAHAELLVLRPRDAEPAHLRALEAAGWDADGIITLSQLVSFVTFQLRIAHGLRVLAATPATETTEELR